MAQVRGLGTGGVADTHLDDSRAAWMLHVPLPTVVPMKVRVVWFLVLAALAATPLLGCPAPTPFTPPAPDSCAKPEPGALTTLEIGPGDFDDKAPFQPWKDGDEVHMILGGQGGLMIGVRIRVTGAGPLPTCLPQVTHVNAEDGKELQKVATALKTYAAQDGTRVTRTLFVAQNLPERFQVVVEAGGLQTLRTLRMPGAILPVVDGAGLADAVSETGP
jgi:hypothetical protein